MKSIGTSIRLPVEFLRRLDALLPALSKDGRVAAVGEVSRSAALRLALAAGLDTLEKRYAKGGAR